MKVLIIIIRLLMGLTVAGYYSEQGAVDSGLESVIEEAESESVDEATESVTYQTPEYIVMAEGDEYIGYPDELPVVPYKAKLDSVIGDELETGYGLEWTWDYESREESEYFRVWIDCGAYFKVKDVDLVAYYDSETGGMDNDIYAHFDEIYIMKGGSYYYGGKEYTDLEMWLEDAHYFVPRFKLTFDEKGYLIGFMDVEAC